MRIISNYYIIEWIGGGGRGGDGTHLGTKHLKITGIKRDKTMAITLICISKDYTQN